MYKPFSYLHMTVFYTVIVFQSFNDEQFVVKQ